MSSTDGLVIRDRFIKQEHQKAKKKQLRDEQRRLRGVKSYPWIPWVSALILGSIVVISVYAFMDQVVINNHYLEQQK